MENTLLDRQTLEQAADALLAQKYPDQPAESLSAERETIIAGLDDAIVDKLNPEQLDTYLNLLNTEQEDSSVFENFFSSNGINLEAVSQEATTNYVKQYLGGENA